MDNKLNQTFYQLFNPKDDQKDDQTIRNSLMLQT